MDLEETARALVKGALSADMRMTLARVARQSGVNYKRLWSFMLEENPGRLSGSETQALYETLTGRPLLPDTTR